MQKATKAGLVRSESGVRPKSFEKKRKTARKADEEVVP